MDQQAFNTFYHNTHTLLYGYVLRLCGDPAVSDDIVQESYLRFMERPPKQEQFMAQKSYLYTIATRKLADHFRGNEKMKQTGIAMNNNPAETDQPVFKEEADPAVQEALDLLSHNDKTLLWLAYVEGYGHREIGQVMNLQPKSIRVLLFRARNRLKELLSQKIKSKT